MIVYEDTHAAVIVLLSAGNAKVCGTGPLVRTAAQVYYLPSRAALDAAGVDLDAATAGKGGAPLRAVLTVGADSTCPSACPHRSTARGGAGSCYVTKGRPAWALGGVLRRYLAGGYPTVDPVLVGRWIAAQAAVVRLGAYGDPTSAPLAVAQALVEPLGRWTGYTAAWQDCDPAWQRYVMASVSSVDEAAAAAAAGWRYYRVRAVGEDLAPGERVCPAAREASTHGDVSCATCRQCDGTARGANRPHFVIMKH